MVLSDRFSASRFWDEIRHYGATQFNYLGAVIPILAKQPKKDNDADNPASIALGAGCPANIMEEVEARFGIKCLEGFGMTEIGIPIHVRVNDRRAGSCGKPMDIYEFMLVDDEEVMVNIFKSMLEKLGYKVTARTSSIEALEAFRNKPQGFDLVVTDMTMPNMTGKDLAKELMVIRPDIPIILCTGFSEKIDEARAKEMGLSAFVMKPIVMRDMANTIRGVLDEK